MISSGGRHGHVHLLYSPMEAPAGLYSTATKTPSWPRGASLPPALCCLLTSSVFAHHCSSEHRARALLTHKGKSSGASLCQPQGEGFPGRKPTCLRLVSSSGVSGLLIAAWRQPPPARGQGMQGLLTHSFCPYYTPTFNFEE